jgi:hypothetical protein
MTIADMYAFVSYNPDTGTEELMGLRVDDRHWQPLISVTDGELEVLRTIAKRLSTDAAARGLRVKLLHFTGPEELPV